MYQRFINPKKSKKIKKLIYNLMQILSFLNSMIFIG